LRGITSAHQRSRPLSRVHISLAGADVPSPGKDVAANHLLSSSPHGSGKNKSMPQAAQLRVLPQIAGESFARSRSTWFFTPIGRIKDTSGTASRTTPLGPLTKTTFFAAPTLNRSLLAGSPPPVNFCQTESWSFSSTSWVTTCHRDDPEIGPPGLTRLAVISSSHFRSAQLDAALAQSQCRKVRSLLAQWVKYASLPRSPFRAEALHFLFFTRRGRMQPLHPTFPRSPGIILRSIAFPTHFGRIRCAPFRL
jgi:hypothetical protein